MKAKPIEQLARDLKLRIAPEVLEKAFLHSSYSNEVGDPRGSNERLEFLGDAVIDLAVTSHLYESFPDADEGRLTKAKSVAVSRPTLAEKADELGLAEYLRLGKGEEANNGRERPNNRGNAFEALVAILYLERGFSYAQKFVVRCLEADIERYLAEETAQRLFDCRPTYSLAESRGKEHHKEFTISVSVAGHRSVGRGRTKKEAEQAAAKQLYLILEEF